MFTILCFLYLYFQAKLTHFIQFITGYTSRKYLLGAHTWVNKLRVYYFNFILSLQNSRNSHSHYELWIPCAFHKHTHCLYEWVQECAFTVTHSHSYECRIKETQRERGERERGLRLKYACPADYWKGMPEAWVVKGTAGGVAGWNLHWLTINQCCGWGWIYSYVFTNYSYLWPKAVQTNMRCCGCL